MVRRLRSSSSLALLGLCLCLLALRGLLLEADTLAAVKGGKLWKGQPKQEVEPTSLGSKLAKVFDEEFYKEWSDLKNGMLYKAGAVSLGLLLVLGLGPWGARRAVEAQRSLKRPYRLKDLDDGESVADPEADLTRAIAWLQDNVVLPIDERLPGRPFEYDLQQFPSMPTVLIIGNHSSGKSTFINRLMGAVVQETGVAPTDDGFTVLERHPDSEQFEDGPTLMACSQNRQFRDLQRFGRSFSGHFRRKRVVLPEGTDMPFGLQLVDTPGMIDLPGNNDATSKARGYNFVDLVRWWAKRSDLVLLLFDPDKPGTTGETLEVLTKSLAGLEHKMLVVLNKVDQLDNNVDFGRAYGTLGWALSKVIPQKDIPMIKTMYNEREAGQHQARPRGELELDAFVKSRSEVVWEVLRAKVRHWDNVVTSFEECLRQIQMVATVSAAVRSQIQIKLWWTWGCGLAVLAVPWLAAAWLLGPGGYHWPGPKSVLTTAAMSYGLVCAVICGLMREYIRQSQQIQVSRAGLSSTFEKVYNSSFIHTDGEDLRSRWETVRPKIESLLKAVRSPRLLPVIASWETQIISEILKKDVYYFRQLARILRPAEPKMPGQGDSGRRTESRDDRQG